MEVASSCGAKDDGDADIIKEAAALSREKALIPLVEDVSEWLSRVVGVPVDPADFMNCLDDGVILCQLIQKVQDKQANSLKEKIKYNTKAAKGGWHARDNAATFIMWCKHFGVKTEVLFESDGLVHHKQKREVVLCLLELSRFASRYGIEPPSIIKLEKEIEQDEKLLNRLNTCKSANSKKLPPGKSKLADIDGEVKEMTGSCKCTPAFYVEKLTDGIYTLGSRRCLIRRFKGRHIMVRVGGGWDTLENYLACHDPCRIALFRKAGGQADMLSVKTSHGEVLEKGYKSSSQAAPTEDREESFFEGETSRHGWVNKSKSSIKKEVAMQLNNQLHVSGIKEGGEGFLHVKGKYSKADKR